MKRYERLANEIALSIRNGVLARGARLPSIRQTSLGQGVSPSTVFQAYYLLEAQGLITARERSGYFVSGGASLPPPEAVEPVSSAAAEVDVSELVFDILESTRARQVVPFGSAFPSPLLFPLQRLASHMASSIKAMDPWTTVADLSPGDAALRRQIALRYLTDGMSVPVEQIVVTSGALEALNLCLAAVTQPGDTVLIEAPAFYASLQAIQRNGLKAVEIPVHPQHGLALEAVEQAIQRHRPKACWVMTSFQNPTGSLMPDARKRQLVELLARHQIPLIEDDVYAELYFGAHKPAPAKFYDRDGLVLHCSSFSKCLAPGYRVGWVAPGRYAKAVERIKLTTSLAASVPAQQALASYLGKGGYDRHLRGLRHTLMIQQMQFLQAIAAHFPAGTRLCKPDGGYFVWVQLPQGIDALQVHRAALQQHISVAPGPMFSAQRGFKDYLRLNYGHSWDAQSQQALAQLGEIVRRLAR